MDASIDSCPKLRNYRTGPGCRKVSEELGIGFEGESTSRSEAKSQIPQSLATKHLFDFWESLTAAAEKMEFIDVLPSNVLMKNTVIQPNGQEVPT